MDICEAKRRVDLAAELAAFPSAILEKFASGQQLSDDTRAGIYVAFGQLPHEWGVADKVTECLEILNSDQWSRLCGKLIGLAHAITKDIEYSELVFSDSD